MIFYLRYRKDPTEYYGHGVYLHANTISEIRDDPDSIVGRFTSRDVLVEITEQQCSEIENSSEPSKLIADWFGLPYQKYIVAEDKLPNVVELLDDRQAFNQPCRFGNLVEGHAVYCHNHTWVDAPRKCRRTWYTGGQTRDEDCPGYEPNTSRRDSTDE